MAKAGTKSLFVYAEDEYAGELNRSRDGATRFQYDSDCKRPISLSLPLQSHPHTGPHVFNYFENLLPDSKSIRERIAQNTRAESTQAFDLLKTIGHECVGALRFQLEKIQRDKSTGLKPISNKDIRDILGNLKSFPLGLTHKDFDFRISVAGVQEKTALTLYQSKWHIPQGETPTTHILKPPMGKLQNGIDLSSSVENEWLCLKICKAFGLEVANAEMADFEGQPCLVVERFDRAWKGDHLHRIPQEDMCQALGIAPHMKYESDHRAKSNEPRPDIATILQLLNQSDHRRRDREQFFRAQITFYLLAATDGHAKNFSLFLTPNQFQMTPIYDVMSAYPAMQSKQIQKKQIKLAMSIGENRHYVQSETSGRHYFQAAKANGITKNAVERIFDELKTAATHLKSTIEVPREFSNFVFESIIEGTQKMAKKL